MIYLDNAATTIHKPPQVMEAVMKAMTSAGNCGRGTYGESLSAAKLIYDARVKIAAFFGCPRADHVVFTANVTEALNLAICGLISSGDHVITTDLEHNSVLRPLYRLQKEAGVELDFLPADAQGNIDIEMVEQLIRPNTRAIVCTHASNLTGNLIDLEAMGAVAKKHKILLIADCAQSAGAVPVDMIKMGIDVLCFTGHKGLLGPQGTGGLCIREGLELRPLKVGGSGVQSFSRTQPQELPTALEAGTLNAHGIAGLSAAIDYINEIGIQSIHCKEIALMKRFMKGIKDLPGIKCYGDFSGDRVAIVALNLAEHESGRVSDVLSQEYGIATRPGAHCAPRMHDALGTHNQGAVRFSFSNFNTEEEIDKAIIALRSLTE